MTMFVVTAFDIWWEKNWKEHYPDSKFIMTQGYTYRMMEEIEMKNSDLAGACQLEHEAMQKIADKIQTRGNEIIDQYGCDDCHIQRSVNHKCHCEDDKAKLINFLGLLVYELEHGNFSA